MADHLRLPLVAKARPFHTRREAEDEARRYRREGFTDTTVDQKRDGRWWVLAERVPEASDG